MNVDGEIFTLYSEDTILSKKDDELSVESFVHIDIHPIIRTYDESQIPEETIESTLIRIMKKLCMLDIIIAFYSERHKTFKLPYISFAFEEYDKLCRLLRTSDKLLFTMATHNTKLMCIPIKRNETSPGILYHVMMLLLPRDMKIFADTLMAKFS